MKHTIVELSDILVRLECEHCKAALSLPPSAIEPSRAENPALLWLAKCPNCGRDWMTAGDVSSKSNNIDHLVMNVITSIQLLCNRMAPATDSSSSFRGGFKISLVVKSETS
jgi:hypothetical protein